MFTLLSLLVWCTWLYANVASYFMFCTANNTTTHFIKQRRTNKSNNLLKSKIKKNDPRVVKYPFIFFILIYFEASKTLNEESECSPEAKLI